MEKNPSVFRNVHVYAQKFEIMIQGERAINVAQWVGWADDEYVAARHLLLADFLIQGSGLANTAIEKYLKALFPILGLKNPWGHEIDKLYAKVKQAGLTRQINEEYLSLLTKSYRLRYFDNLPVGFNIHLNRTKLLVELDHTVYEVRKGFTFKKADGNKVVLRLENYLEKKDPNLLSKNCYFGCYNRADLFKEESSCYELRVLEQRIFEAFYATKEIRDDGKFNEEGLKPGTTSGVST
jgi:HEPN domain-containing protein